MFDTIACRYDFLNHFLSLGVDRLWRKRAVKLLQPVSPGNILDVATGTGDFALAALSLNPESIIGIDLSEKMLSTGREKLKNKKLGNRIVFQQGDAEELAFADGTFDAFTVAFGVRNFNSPEKGLGELYRILKQGGTGIILEFSIPEIHWVRNIYRIYLFHILPVLGRWLSKDPDAYSYLPDSIGTFPDRKTFLNLMQSVGFKGTVCRDLTFGIASIYIGHKQE